MRRLFVATAVLLLLAGPCLADEKAAVAQAQTAATNWLVLTDGAKYGQSWEDAASVFKAAVTKTNWESAAKGVRAPLGSVTSRKLRAATFTRTLPGVPDGEYVVIQFDTQFANKAAAVETITPMHEKDGSWRVSGYFIK